MSQESVKILPLPTLLNEESFGSFPSRQTFIAAIGRLILTLKELERYGFAKQLSCSRSIMDRICYADVTFGTWLRLGDAICPEEKQWRSYLRLMIGKVPPLEDAYPSFYECPEFDLAWNGRCLFVNAARMLPAFVVAIAFRLPTVALRVNAFCVGGVQEVLLSELRDDTIYEYTEQTIAFSDRQDVIANDPWLTDIISTAIVDHMTFNAVRSGMFPSLKFSDEVEDALAKHRIDFRSVSVVRALIRLQKACVDMCSRQISFEEAYGRVKTLAMRESDTVVQKMPETREFSWGGDKRFCFPHLKIGSSFRVHFRPDKDAKCVYVGYMGEHLPL